MSLLTTGASAGSGPGLLGAPASDSLQADPYHETRQITTICNQILKTVENQKLTLDASSLPAGGLVVNGGVSKDELKKEIKDNATDPIIVNISESEKYLDEQILEVTKTLTKTLVDNNVLNIYDELNQTGVQDDRTFPFVASIYQIDQRTLRDSSRLQTLVTDTTSQSNAIARVETELKTLIDMTNITDVVTKFDDKLDKSIIKKLDDHTAQLAGIQTLVENIPTSISTSLSSGSAAAGGGSNVLTEQIAVLNAELGITKSQLAKSEAKLKTETDKLQQYEQQIKDKDELKDKSKQIESQNNQILAKDQTISEQSEKEAELNAKILKLEQDIQILNSSGDNAAAQLVIEKSALQDKIVALQDKISSLEAELQETTQKNVTIDAELQQSKTELHKQKKT